jgi:hypothetical protein
MPRALDASRKFDPLRFQPPDTLIIARLLISDAAASLRRVTRPSSDVRFRG